MLQRLLDSAPNLQYRRNGTGNRQSFRLSRSDVPMGRHPHNPRASPRLSREELRPSLSPSTKRPSRNSRELTSGQSHSCRRHGRRHSGGRAAHSRRRAGGACGGWGESLRQCSSERVAAVARTVRQPQQAKRRLRQRRLTQVSSLRRGLRKEASALSRMLSKGSDLPRNWRGPRRRHSSENTAGTPMQDRGTPLIGLKRPARRGIRHEASRCRHGAASRTVTTTGPSPTSPRPRSA